MATTKLRELCVQTESGRRHCTIGQAYCSCCKNRPTWAEEMAEADAAAKAAEKAEYDSGSGIGKGAEFYPHVVRTHPAWKPYLLFANSRGHVQCPACSKTLQILPWPDAWKAMDED